MTGGEFKKWLRGFGSMSGACISDAPTPEQWARIKARVDEIDDEPMKREHFMAAFRAAASQPSCEIFLNSGVHDDMHNLGEMEALRVRAERA